LTKKASDQHPALVLKCPSEFTGEPLLAPRRHVTDSIPARLADGSPPATPEELLALLDEMGIESATHHHPPVFTVEEAQEQKGDLPGAHTKNLFLRDRRGRMWLVVALHDRPLDLLALARAMKPLGVAGRLSFGSGERLMKWMGLTPGAVSPFGLVNDRQGKVRVALDLGLQDQEIWNAHPLSNEMTTALSPDEMIRFLEAVDHPPVWVDFDAMEVEDDG
jgi:Ala-tRNA(Pro) deacylase